MPEFFPPFLLFFAGALILPVLPRATRAWAFLLPPLASLVLMGRLEDGLTLTLPFLEWELLPLQVDRMSLLFGWVFSIAALLGGIYALHLRDTGQQVSALLYAGSALGVVFAGDLFTLFVFWEIMAVTSAYLVWARRTKRSLDAGMRYIYAHLFGGSLLLGGILLHLGDTGSLAFEAFTLQTPAAWLILLGFALNAAVPPLHGWLADAYPEATITGAVFMSAFTTKTAVYTLARGFAGWDILVGLGVIMALYGVVYALLSDDIRRILAYGIVSQVGYMVAGIGIGSEMALNGATAHAFTHILYKGLLLMAAGAVIHATGKSRLSELGGLWRAMPVVVVLFMVGALAKAGLPLLSGFVSKSITVDAAQYAGLSGVVLLLHLASIGTFLHTGLRLPYFTWGGPERRYETNPLPWNMIASMGLAALLNLYLGLVPKTLFALLPFALDWEPYTWSHLTKAIQMLSFTFLAFWLFRSKLGGEAKLAMDTDWVYRRPAAVSYQMGPVAVARVFGGVERAVMGIVGSVVRLGRDPVGRLQSGSSTAAWPGGSASTSFRVSLGVGMVFILAVTLLVLIRLALIRG